MIKAECEDGWAHCDVDCMCWSIYLYIYICMIYIGYLWLIEAAVAASDRHLSRPGRADGATTSQDGSEEH